MGVLKMKEIKLFDGIKVTTDNEVEKFPDMTLFDKALICTAEQRENIITNLFCFHVADLSKAVGHKYILTLYNNQEQFDYDKLREDTSVLINRE